MTVDGAEIDRTELKRIVPTAFSATETFDVGVDLGSPAGLNYADRPRFQFDGKIKQVVVMLN